jgi:hypothetical protein
LEVFDTGRASQQGRAPEKRVAGSRVAGQRRAESINEQRGLQGGLK